MGGFVLEFFSCNIKLKEHRVHQSKNS